jgi:hypothetical protein
MNGLERFHGLEEGKTKFGDDQPCTGIDTVGCGGG